MHCGAAELIGTDADLLVRRASELLSCTVAHAKMANVANPIGDGSAGKIIVDEIVSRFRVPVAIK